MNVNNEKKKWAEELKEKEASKGLVFKIRMSEGKADNFIKDEVEPKATQTQDGLVVQGVWTDWLITTLKERSLSFIISIAHGLVVRNGAWAISGVNEISKGLEEKIIELYQQVNEEEKKVYLEKMLEIWPESSLVRRLRNHYSK